jgi:hypothetical protein
LLTNKSTSSTSYEVKDKVKLNDPTVALGDWSMWGPLIMESGDYPNYLQEYFPIARSSATIKMSHWQWKFDTSDNQDERYSQAAVAVPIYDSEAIYVWTRKTHRKSSETSRITYSSEHPGNPSYEGMPWTLWKWFRPVSWETPFDYRVRRGWCQSFGLAGLYTVSTETITVPLHVESHEMEKKLISHGGVTDVDSFPGVPIDDSIDGSFFYNAEEYLPVTFETYSGTRTTNPVVIALGRITTIGGTDGVDTDTVRNFYTEPIALVGWV